MSVKDFQNYLIEEFSNPKVRDSIRATMKFLIKNPLAHAGEKLGRDLFETLCSQWKLRVI
ncbi:hypothetical protein SACC_32760 [Saccharolobus caldissimus]|uniref:Uncharacterized protein n=1 Tax=Saccharolobus caldissimus TaxID=1702097 RepID=A0AAQ4CWS8_9CREN|nr:hypothetical protein [Saccharolobus caldissimus]BDC00260.1 hypothetical protein SACC_32760 [Saccharolobus caldissimus]